ncbi:hypothetical protein QFZ77_006334 [Paenibacillus sp. V4I3]|uniref:hypothetical protein n=1 Tax=Paenibacillus sp. V4I9 TaxID=3042308 RepID=UPI002782C77A|nr:hypothetical protein [Paenibacillus sp. V4I3]MDQ0886449.1 hypothetical protein [Paenibacillus sp. V4I9]
MTILSIMPASVCTGHFNVASLVAFFPGPMMSVYYATKPYVLSFTVERQEHIYFWIRALRGFFVLWIYVLVFYRGQEHISIADSRQEQISLAAEGTPNCGSFARTFFTGEFVDRLAEQSLNWLLDRGARLAGGPRWGYGHIPF